MLSLSDIKFNSKTLNDNMTCPSCAQDVDCKQNTMNLFNVIRS